MVEAEAVGEGRMRSRIRFSKVRSAGRPEVCEDAAGLGEADADALALFASGGIRRTSREDDLGDSAQRVRYAVWGGSRRSGQGQRSGPCSSTKAVGVDRNTSALTGP